MQAGWDQTPGKCAFYTLIKKLPLLPSGERADVRWGGSWEVAGPVRFHPGRGAAVRSVPHSHGSALWRGPCSGLSVPSPSPRPKELINPDTRGTGAGLGHRVFPISVAW